MSLSGDDRRIFEELTSGLLSPDLPRARPNARLGVTAFLAGAIVMLAGVGRSLILASTGSLLVPASLATQGSVRLLATDRFGRQARTASKPIRRKARYTLLPGTA